jgi:thiol-disulfide isomerase/thioredoxin
MDFAEIFATGYPYSEFLTKYGTSHQRSLWEAMFQRTTLNDVQQKLLASFKREMPVLVLAGAWCGDCIDQCPILARFAEASPAIKLHFFDRDEACDLAQHVRICGGHRVPSVLFLSEDWHEVARFGDKTLVKYRDLYQKTSGETCSTGLIVDKTLQTNVVQEWLEHFERAQLILRTSPRLRTKHGD